MTVVLVLVFGGASLAVVSAVTGWGWPELMIVGIGCVYWGLWRLDAKRGVGPLS